MKVVKDSQQNRVVLFIILLFFQYKIYWYLVFDTVWYAKHEHMVVLKYLLCI